MRRAIQSILSLGVLACAFYFLDWAALVDALSRVRLSAFLQAMSLALIGILIMAARWYCIISPHVRLPVRNQTQIYLYATFLNSFTPANVGGDLYRLVTLSTRGATFVVVTLALIRERVVGLVAYLLGYTACFVVLWARDMRIASAGNGIFAWSAVIAVLVVLTIALVPIAFRHLTQWSPIARRPRLIAILRDLASSVTSQSASDFLVLFGLSFLSLAFWIAAIGSIAHDVEFEVPWLMLGAIAVLVEIIRLVPISMQGIGVREATFALLASFVGVSAEAGFVVAAISYLALSATLLCCGVIGWGLMLGTRSARADTTAGSHELD